jgi:hypothetical protein
LAAPSPIRTGATRMPLFIDGLVHRGGYDAAALLDALTD